MDAKAFRLVPIWRYQLPGPRARRKRVRQAPLHDLSGQLDRRVNQLANRFHASMHRAMRGAIEMRHK